MGGLEDAAHEESKRRGNSQRNNVLGHINPVNDR